MVTGYSNLLLIILLGLSSLNAFQLVYPSYISTSEIERHLLIFGSCCCGITCLAVGNPCSGIGTCCLATGCYICIVPPVAEKIAKIIDQQPGRVNSLRR